VVQALSVIAMLHLLRGHTDLGIAVFNHAADVARKHQLTFELALVLGNLGAFQVNRDPLASLAASEQAAELYEQSGYLPHLWVSLINEAIVLTNAGRWDEMDSVFDRPSLQDADPPLPLQSVIAVQRAQIAIARGTEVDLDKLRELAENVQDDRAESLDDMFYLACDAVRCRAAGDAAEIVRSCRRVVASAYRLNALDDDFPSLWNRAVDWTIDAGDLDAARELLAPVADALPTRRNPLLIAQLPRLRASIEAVDPSSATDPAGIEADLLESIAALDRLGIVPDRARAQATLGRWLIRQGRSAEAEPHLAAARRTFTDLGANAWLRDLDDAPSLSVAG
jgi:hypothetical protein